MDKNKNSTKGETPHGKDQNIPPTEEKVKKQIPLRLSASLYRDLSAWAEEDFRSINGQIEYLLTQSVNKRKKK